jgi:hypothetical protein
LASGRPPGASLPSLIEEAGARAYPGKDAAAVNGADPGAAVMRDRVLIVVMLGSLAALCALLAVAWVSERPKGRPRYMTPGTSDYRLPRHDRDNGKRA